LPEGHVPLARHMNVPIFESGRIVAVAGVGNKEEDYDESDIRQLTLLMDGMWKLLERNRTALEIKESEERYRLLFEHSPDVVGIFRGGHVIAVSPVLTEFLGYEPKELLGKTPPDISPEYQPNGLSSKDEARRHLVDAITDGPQYFEWTHLHKNGSLLYTEVTLAAYTVRGETYVQSITRDVTEKKRAEEERRQFERQVEAQKRLFYRETILSVTEGKLEICDQPDIEPYITRAQLKIEVKGPAEVSPARVKAEEFCKDNGLAGDKLDAFAIAIGEAITNSVKHGGEGHVYAGFTDDAVWVAASDKGKGIESLILPRATLLRGFSTKPSLGLGYSIMLDVSDRILLNTGEQGTTVILIKSIKEPELTLSNIPDTWENIPGI